MATTELYQGLTFLSYSTGVIVILVGVMLVSLTISREQQTANRENHKKRKGQLGRIHREPASGMTLKRARRSS